jgi:hypothetical protein
LGIECVAFFKVAIHAFALQILLVNSLSSLVPWEDVIHIELDATSSQWAFPAGLAGEPVAEQDAEPLPVGNLTTGTSFWFHVCSQRWDDRLLPEDLPLARYPCLRD